MKCPDAAILKKQSRDIDWVPKDNPGIRLGPVRNDSQSFQRTGPSTLHALT
jgi:hypothetical protein